MPESQKVLRHALLNLLNPFSYLARLQDSWVGTLAGPMLAVVLTARGHDPRWALFWGIVVELLGERMQSSLGLYFYLRRAEDGRRRAPKGNP